YFKGEIGGGKLTIDMTASPEGTQEVNKTVSFTTSVKGGMGPYTYVMKYGDGEEKSILSSATEGKLFSHKYTKSGNYNITVLVTDNTPETSVTTIPNYVITAPQGEKSNPTLDQFYYTENPVKKPPTDPPDKFNLYGDKEVNVYFKIKNYPEKGKTWIMVKNATNETVTTSSLMGNEEVWTWVDKNYAALKDGEDYTLNIYIAGIKSEIKFAESLTLHVGEPAKILEPEICDNGTDDDGDGLVDVADKIDCKVAEEVVPPQCSDDLDNDGDKLIDFPDDKDCQSEDDILEASDKDLNELPQCNDGLDNDKDDDIDYPNDDGCEALDDDTEDSDFNIPKGVDIKISKVSVSKTKFNPEIHEVYFVYTISGDANVKIEILDKDGKVVATAEEEKAQKKGQHVAWWNGTIDNKFAGQKIADGTYTYKITATHPEYSEVKDTKEGSITADSTAGNGEGDFEDPDGGGAKPGDGTGNGDGTLDKTPGGAKTDDATQTLQNSTTGQTAGTGPGILLYLLIPALVLPLIKKSGQKIKQHPQQELRIYR
ncbi:MAG: FlgD immunoglobulin-like domain containing protein, partial [Candidatus Gracilibacteria bacterium]